MLEFSGGYLPINPNFVVGLKSKGPLGDGTLNGYLSIAKNLLFRCGTVKPSPFLEEILGAKKKYSRYLTHNSTSPNLMWNSVIKGGENTNPAQKFFDILKSEIPEEYHYFLPECPFYKIAPEATDIATSAVDFYSPVFQIAIEIDGIQHNDTEAKVIDAERDKLLRKHNVTIVRIPSKDVYSGNLAVYINKIKAAIINKGYQNFVNELDATEKSYLFAFRFQVAFLEAISAGLVDFAADSYSIDVLTHDKDIELHVFEAALADIRQLLTNLATLNGEDLKFPQIALRVISDSADMSVNRLTFDINIAERYDQNIENVADNYISVRNDYFLYPVKGLVEETSRFKNYYSLYCSSFRFSNISHKNAAQRRALLYFLELIFRFKSFRSNQEAIVCNSFNTRNAVIGILPTGAGKSICYQLVGLLTPGLTVIVSPLKSLMDDQCANLYGDHMISAATAMHGGTTNAQKDLFYQNKCKFLYIAPERFFNPDFKQTFSKITSNVSQVVIDEVHCLSEWGHAFRTSYLLLFNFLRHSGLTKNIYLIGTTATASLQVINDIAVEFGKLDKNVITEQSDMMTRPELRFGIIDVKSSNDRYKAIASRVRSHISANEQTVVFAPFKKTLEYIKNEIPLTDDELDEVATFSSETKNQSEIIAKLQKGDIKALVATTAFGMGLDIKHIRHTIHYCIGASVESVYQEMGRAGRDGQHADCHICFQKDDADLGLFKVHGDDNFDYETLDSRSELKERLFLIKQSNYPYEADSELTFELYKILSASDGAISYETLSNSLKPAFENCEPLKVIQNPSPSLSTNLVEKYLYRLYLLKLIDLWSVSYSNNTTNPTYGNITIIDRTNEEVKEALEAYIGMYEPGFKCQIPLQMEKGEFVRAAISFLCKWNFENFFMCRWRSLATLYDMLYNFKDSETFATRINIYFSRNDVLKAIAEYDDVEDYHIWFKAFRSGVSLEKLKYQLARYLESPSCSFGIKFVSSLVRLQENDFNSIEGKPRLKNVLDYIVRSSKFSLFNELMIYTLDFLPNKQDKQTLLSFLLDNYKELIMTEKFVNKLDSISGGKTLKERIALVDMKDTLSDFKIAMEEINA